MQRAFVLIFTCCFLVAGSTHGRDIWRGGFFPYQTVAMPINAFWTALCPLDLTVAALVWWRPKSAVLLGLGILLVDVGVNSWLTYFSGLHVESFEPLQAQSLFLGFVIGGAMFILSGNRSEAR